MWKNSDSDFMTYQPWFAEQRSLLTSTNFGSYKGRNRENKSNAWGYGSYDWVEVLEFDLTMEIWWNTLCKNEILTSLLQHSRESLKSGIDEKGP